MTRDNGVTVWQVRYRAYGNVWREEIAEVATPLRFQGQYFDAETGLHYNRHRYYQPETCRFITPDPIGLAGGLNNYQYAPNPIGWVDPQGLTNIPGQCPDKLSRRGAFRNAKRDSNIPVSQSPDRVFNTRTQRFEEYDEVLMTDRNKVPVLNDHGGLVYTKEYHFTREDGSKVVIQDHSAGHRYGPEGTEGNQGSHFNVRSIENKRTGKVDGTKEHYNFRIKR